MPPPISQFAVRAVGFPGFPASELVRDRAPSSARKPRGIGSKKTRSSEVRDALSKDLETLSRHYTERAQRIYTRIDEGIDHTAMQLSLLAAFAVHAGGCRRC